MASIVASVARGEWKETTTPTAADGATRVDYGAGADFQRQPELIGTVIRDMYVRDMNKPFNALAELSDETLLVAFGLGDREAAGALTSRLTPRVLGFATRMLGDRAEAEDVAQEAMLRLWRIAPEWRQGEAKVTTWLYRVVANLCTDRLRKRRGVGLDTIEEPVDPTPNVEVKMQLDQRAEALETALQALPERQKQAVILRHIDGVSNPEIAEVMGISTEAVESLTARGKRTLAKILAGRHAELGYNDDE